MRINLGIKVENYKDKEFLEEKINYICKFKKLFLKIKLIIKEYAENDILGCSLDKNSQFRYLLGSKNVLVII